MMSLLLDEVALAAARLAEAGVESPRTDAELIAASVHNVRRGELHLVADADFYARFWAEIARRAAREPLQHINGRAHFRYLELDVGPGVFVPRPETEVMTGWAIDRLREMDVAAPVVADLGTGSGAIALAALTYPTAIRSTGVGWAMGVGRFAQVLTPLFAGYVTGAGWSSVQLFVVLAILPVLAALAIIVLRTLPAHSAAAETISAPGVVAS